MRYMVWDGERMMLRARYIVAPSIPAKPVPELQDVITALKHCFVNEYNQVLNNIMYAGGALESDFPLHKPFKVRRKS